MRISDKQELIQYIESLIEINNLNMSISDMFTSVLGNRSIISDKEVEVLKKKFNKHSLDIIKDALFDYWELDRENEEDCEIFDNYIASCIQEVDENKYLNNPYYQNIHFDNIRDDKFSLEKDHYTPYELFAYKDMSYFDGTYIEQNSIAYFTKTFDFLSINENKTTWMSVIPNEIETMEKAIELANGKVIVYGLGLGYFPYMISLKENVKEITIVENNEKVIDLFNKYIFPQFAHKEKIKVIKDDAFEYMKKAIDFDFAFIDLWHNPEDGIELFINAKKLEKENKAYSYWLESSFYILLRRCMISLLEEQLSGADESMYISSKSVTDSIINIYYQKTKKLALNNREQVDELLSDSTLLNLLIK